MLPWGATTTSRNPRGRYHRLCQDPGGGGGSSGGGGGGGGGGGHKKKVRFCPSVSVVRHPPSVRQGLGGLEALAIRERYGEGTSYLYSPLPSTSSLALRRQHREEPPLRVKMLSYVLPVEEKVGLRGDDEERSPGSETRPLLGSGEGASLMVLQHALTHAPGHEDAPEKPPIPASPPLNGDHHHHTATITATSMETPPPPPPPPQDASANTTATSSTATSPGLQPHHHTTPVTTTTTAKPNLKR